MGIDLYTARTKAKQIASSASQISQAQNSLRVFKTRLSRYWQSPEIKNISAYVDRMIAEIDSISKELNSISDDINAVSGEIKKEEEIAKARSELSVSKADLQKRKSKYNAAVNAYKADPSSANAQRMCEEKAYYALARANYNDAVRKLNSLQ